MPLARHNGKENEPMLDVADAQLISMATCGKFNHWCCLNAAQLDELLTMAEEKGATYVTSLHRYTCLCRQRGKDAEQAVDKWVNDGLCSPAIITVVVIANEALEAALIFTIAMPKPAKLAALAAAAATQAWIVACAEDKMTVQLILSICRALTRMLTTIKELPEAVQVVLTPLTKLLEMAVVSDQLKAGCTTTDPSIKPLAWVDQPQLLDTSDPASSPWLTSDLLANLSQTDRASAVA